MKIKIDFDGEYFSLTDYEGKEVDVDNLLYNKIIYIMKEYDNIQEILAKLYELN